jgi:hypothetical protein
MDDNKTSETRQNFIAGSYIVVKCQVSLDNQVPLSQQTGQFFSMEFPECRKQLNASLTVI